MIKKQQKCLTDSGSFITKWASFSKYYGLILFFSILTGCSEQSVQKLEGSAQGTTYHISYWSELPMDGKDIEASIKKEFDIIDKTLSNYRPDSIIETFNSTENTDSQEVGNEIVSLVRIAQTVHQATQGCFDLTIKPLFELWGFRGDELTIPNDTSIRKTLSQIGMEKLEVVDETHLRKKQSNLKVDLSSIAQGYSVGKISRVLEQKGIKNYLVEIGGELKTRGHKPDSQAWRIAVERPLPGAQVMQKIITMPKESPIAVMTSGTYRHYFDHEGKRYSHILDARTGRPVTHDLVSITVIHEDPTIADAWDTALLCLGQEDGMKVANAEKIPVLFIQQQGNELIESRSDALNTLDSLTIH
ncbi:MAG: FAD:protein FMN transferase [Methylococcaceae bacterium]|nr:FAD:protein FMN transferase [Methylococcaceae bacterium]